MHNFKCKFCNKDACSKRSDAVFCSAVCRTNNNTQLNKDRVVTYKKQYYSSNKNKLDKINLERYYSKKPKLEDRICGNCQVTYSPTRIDRKFCSAKCGVEFWRTNNTEHSNDYFRKLYATDLNRKIGSCLRNRLRSALKGETKSKRTLDLLGCTIEELKLYLESKFKPGMGWDNWTTNGWHIDHKKPLAAFDLADPAQQLEACHYSNLQPLWAEENLSKGDNYVR